MLHCMNGKRDIANVIKVNIFTSQMARWVKNLPAIQETQEMWVQSLGQEDPLKEEMATHSKFLSGESPWTEELGGLQYMGSQRVGHD